jgi:hypothetical protein
VARLSVIFGNGTKNFLDGDLLAVPSDLIGRLSSLFLCCRVTV